MTRRQVLFAALALLTLLVACGGKYGGDYPINPVEVKSKEGIFNDFKNDAEKENGWPKWSEATELTAELLEQSIIHHKNRTPYGLQGQRYNYVITPGDQIIVAQWATDPTVDMKQVAKACAIKGAVNDLKDTAKFMVNFYPEGPIQGESKILLCAEKIKEDDKEKDRKILDELTKHFMLAQGSHVDNIGFKTDWKDKEVAFAGEIIVNVEDCMYAVTDGSGTYIKDKDYGIDDLKEVAKRFGEIEDLIAPAYRMDKGKMTMNEWEFLENNHGKLDKDWCKEN